MHFHSLSLNGRHTTISELLSKSKKGNRISCKIRDPRFIGIFYEIESRETNIFPPLLSQSLSMSKVHQALHYMDYMVPNTFVTFLPASPFRHSAHSFMSLVHLRKWKMLKRQT